MTKRTFLSLLLLVPFTLMAQKLPVAEKKVAPLNRQQSIDKYWSVYKTNNPYIISLEKQLSVLDAEYQKIGNELNMVRDTYQATYKARNGASINSHHIPGTEGIYNKLHDNHRQRLKIQGQIDLIKSQYVQRISRHLPLK